MKIYMALGKMRSPSLAEYHDNKMVVIKFRKGLEPTTQNRVALLGSGAPDFDDPEGWYEMARRVARNREANDAFIEANRNHSRVMPRTPTIPPKPVWVTPQTSATIQQVPTPATTTQKDGPTPMDVDRARARVTPPGVCLRCKKPGHYA